MNNDQNGFDNQIPTVTPTEPTPVDVPIAVDAPAAEPAPVETPVPTVEPESTPVDIPVASVEPAPIETPVEPAPVEAPVMPEPVVSPEVPVEAPVEPAPVEAPVMPEPVVAPEVPVEAPVEPAPVEAPVMPEPVVAPEVPVEAPVAPAPVEAPVMPEPVVAPEAPVEAPVAPAPIETPAAPVAEEPVTPPLPGTTFGADNVAPIPAAPAADGKAKKGLGGKLPIIVGVVVVLLIGIVVFLFKDKLFGGTKVNYSSPKEFYTSKLTETFKTISANDANEAHYKVDLTVDAPALIDKKIELNLDEYYNITDKIIYLVVNGKYDSQQIFDKGITVFVKGEEGYAHFGSLLDKWVKVDVKSTMEEIPAPVETPDLSKMESNMLVIENSMLKAITSSLTDEYFTKTPNDDGSVVFAFELDSAKITKLSKDVLTALNNDAEFKRAYKEITNEDYDISKMTDEEFNETDGGKLSIKTTLKNNKVQKVDAELIIDDNNGFTINGTKASEEELNFTVKVKQDGKESEVASGTLKTTPKTTYFSLTINNIATISLNLEKVTEKFTAPDVSSAVSMDALTEEDTKKMEENMANNKVIAEIMKKIESSMPSEPTYQDPYQYEPDYDTDFNSGFDSDFDSQFDSDFGFDNPVNGTQTPTDSTIEEDELGESTSIEEVDNY